MMNNNKTLKSVKLVLREPEVQKCSLISGFQDSSWFLSLQTLLDLVPRSPQKYPVVSDLQMLKCSLRPLAWKLTPSPPPPSHHTYIHTYINTYICVMSVWIVTYSNVDMIQKCIVLNVSVVVETLTAKVSFWRQGWKNKIVCIFLAVEFHFTVCW